MLMNTQMKPHKGLALALGVGACLFAGAGFDVVYHWNMLIIGARLSTTVSGIIVAAVFIIAGVAAILAIAVARAKRLRNGAIGTGIILFIVFFSFPISIVGFFEQRYIVGEDHLENLSPLYNDKAQWESRAADIRHGILAGAELDPLPDRTPLNAVIHDIRNHTNYTVENVYFESVPGFFVAGNLYRPLLVNATTPKPVILLPHGHFSGNRFAEYCQQLGATFARMGAIAMIYDMVGYEESNQVSHDDDHVLMLQTWNSVRVLDFLLTLDGADPSRVGVAGASGGGTQTILLAAIDDRIAASAPVAMVSASSFGGCNCETGMPIRKGIGHPASNVEIAALVAPKPLLLVSVGTDWTQTTPTVEYPFIQRIYGFYNKTNIVSNVNLPTDKHDFSPSKRDAVYRFFATQFHLAIANVTLPNGTIGEINNTLESRNAMLGFNQAYPRPSYALEGQAAVLDAFTTAQHGTRHSITMVPFYVETIPAVLLMLAGLIFIDFKRRRAGHDLRES
jgi:uncharacterized protein